MIANINDYKRKLADLVIKKTRWLGIFPETFERILGFQRYGGLRSTLKFCAKFRILSAIKLFQG